MGDELSNKVPGFLAQVGRQLMPHVKEVMGFRSVTNIPCLVHVVGLVIVDHGVVRLQARPRNHEPTGRAGGPCMGA